MRTNDELVKLAFKSGYLQGASNTRQGIHIKLEEVQNQFLKKLKEEHTATKSA
ncbi:MULTISPECIES: hypothetical protein [Pseudoalteromonas]|uniref:hypothetical protein n=1 Tax=Pseudoalteromonas TaxID=53246 RepID=UPI0013DDE96E|nr:MULTISPECIES: hypothetical protein [Pseudoalteromonas]MCG7561009.1 hypothetical protein [Pseudoalteromonas sp. McH1-42]MEC4090159.1 hypothetical protein [Pseudoalteromonas rubra]